MWEKSIECVKMIEEVKCRFANNVKHMGHGHKHNACVYLTTYALTAAVILSHSACLSLAVTPPQLTKELVIGLTHLPNNDIVFLRQKIGCSPPLSLFIVTAFRSSRHFVVSAAVGIPRVSRGFQPAVFSKRGWAEIKVGMFHGTKREFPIYRLTSRLD